MKLFRLWHQATAVLVVCLVLLLFILGISLTAKAASPGDLDGTFGFGLTGVTFTDIGTASNDAAHAVALLADGTFLAGQGAKLFYCDLSRQKIWQEIEDLRTYGIHNISRLALSADGKLAMVVQ